MLQENVDRQTREYISPSSRTKHQTTQSRFHPFDQRTNGNCHSNKQAQITPQPVSIRHLTELLREQRPKPHRYVLSTENCNAGQINVIMDSSDGKLMHKMARYPTTTFSRSRPTNPRNQSTHKTKTTLDHVLNYYADENHCLGPNEEIHTPHPGSPKSEKRKTGTITGPVPDRGPSTSLSIKENT